MHARRELGLAVQDPICTQIPCIAKYCVELFRSHGIYPSLPLTLATANISPRLPSVNHTHKPRCVPSLVCGLTLQRFTSFPYLVVAMMLPSDHDDAKLTEENATKEVVASGYPIKGVSICQSC